MIKILIPKIEDTAGMAEVIRLSGYSTYINNEIGATKEDLDFMNSPENEKGQIESFRRRIESPKDTDITFIAKEDEKVVGIIRIVIFPDHVRVRTMYVHPDYMGKGIGTMLWNKAKNELPKDKDVIAFPVEHTRSVDWYKKMGFIETNERQVDVTMPISGVELIGIKMVFNQK